MEVLRPCHGARMNESGRAFVCLMCMNESCHTYEFVMSHTRDVDTRVTPVKILDCLGQTELFTKTEIAGPGFINAHLDPQVEFLKIWLTTKFAY